MSGNPLKAAPCIERRKMLLLILSFAALLRSGGGISTVHQWMFFTVYSTNIGREWYGGGVKTPKEILDTAELLLRIIIYWILPITPAKCVCNVHVFPLYGLTLNWTPLAERLMHIFSIQQIDITNVSSHHKAGKQTLSEWDRGVYPAAVITQIPSAEYQPLLQSVMRTQQKSNIYSISSGLEHIKKAFYYEARHTSERRDEDVPSEEMNYLWNRNQRRFSLWGFSFILWVFNKETTPMICYWGTVWTLHLHLCTCSAQMSPNKSWRSQ